MARLLQILILMLVIPLSSATPALAQFFGAATAEPEAEAGAETPADALSERSTLELLIDVLEDETARAELLAQLRGATEEAGATPDDIVDALADGAAPPEDLSFGRRIALITQEAAEGIADRTSAAWIQLTRAPDVFNGLSGGEAGVLLDALGELALIIVGTVAVFLILRAAGRRLYARMGARANDGGAVRTVVLFIASVIVDALIVVVAWAVGYALALLALGDFGTIGIRQTLYLNAFLLVEMAKVAVRMVLSPSATHLRPLPINDRAAIYLARRLNVIVGVVGYGQLLVVPIINASASFAAGRAISALIAFAVLAFAIYLVLRNRRPVTDWMLGDTGVEPAPAEATLDLSNDATAARLPDRPVAAIEAPAAQTPVDAVAQDETAGRDLRVQTAEVETAPPQEGLAATDPLATTPDETALAGDQTARHRRRRGAFGFLARHWHWPVLAYLLVLFFVVLAQSGDAVFRTFLASGQVLVIGLLGIAISGFISRAMVRGIRLPGSVNHRMPLLERRLNRFVPRVLFVLRILIFVLVVLFALDAISLIDLRLWLASQIGLRLSGVVFSVTFVLLASFIMWLALTSWVDYRLNPDFGSVPTSREQTLLTLLRNAATIALIIITLMFVLSEIGLDIAPLLASAGVLGLAIGFGAQKMVQDIITGIFIQFENAMNVGDVVLVGGTSGVVERLTIRSVSLRDLSGAFHIIPFSAVDIVTNYVRDFGYYLCDMGVAYRENVEEVEQAMRDAFAELRADPEQGPFIMDDLEWFGLNSFGDSAVVLRARIKCIPGKQWGVGRAYNAVLKRVFDERNIEIPFPHQTIYLGESKNGKTQHVKVDLKMDGDEAQPV